MLVDTYIQVRDGVVPRKEAVSQLSKLLREYGASRSIEIDEIYRNENGISMQLAQIDGLFRDEEGGLSNVSKLFVETVTIYRNDKTRFDALLAEARSVINELGSNPQVEISKKDYIRTETDSFLSKKYPVLFVKSYEALKSLEGTDVTAYTLWSELGTTARISTVKHILDEASWSVCNEKLYTYSTDTNSTNQIVDDNKKENLQRILKEHYAYGFRYNSIREMMRFRNFAKEISVELPESDEQLKSEILACGTIIEDKLFCKDDKLPQDLQEMVRDIFSDGTEVIYYEALFSRKAEWMEMHIITSEAMLKEYLQKYVSGCYFAKMFMIKGKRKTEKEAVTSEIKRVWGDRQTENVGTLGERLRYVPLQTIKSVISGNDQFVSTIEGEYMLVDRLVVSGKETQDICDYVDEACQRNGFASLSDVPMGDIEEENYEVPKTALWNAIYKKILINGYHKNGRIVTRGDSNLDAISLLKQYIRNREECTFDEIAERVVDLTGATNRGYAFQALYDEMVRIDKEHFVASDKVTFDIDAIDKILSEFITDGFCSIREVTTFAMFPVCGQSWNHYLLESYCYGYSKRYSLHVLHFNDKNAGIIAEKDINLSYAEMIAIALSKMNIELTEETAGRVLFDTGYMAKSKYGNLTEIVRRAKEIKKER